MRAGTAALAYPAIAGREWVTGWCFMLRGETGIRADPQFAWWYSDDDVCLQAKAAGGVARAYGCEVTHLHPGGHDQVMQAHTGADQELYNAKWDHATPERGTAMTGVAIVQREDYGRYGVLKPVLPAAGH